MDLARRRLSQLSRVEIQRRLSRLASRMMNLGLYSGTTRRYRVLLYNIGYFLELLVVYSSRVGDLQSVYLSA